MVAAADPKMWYDAAPGSDGPVAAGPQPATLPTGDLRITTTDQKAPEEGSGWAKFSEGMKSVTEALVPIAKTGLEYQEARTQRKLAEQRAAEEARLKELRLQTAQSQIQAAQLPFTLQNNTALKIGIGAAVLIGGIWLFKSRKRN